MNSKKDLKQKWKKIENLTRKVLMTCWDPIGVIDIPEAQDEYDSYIGQIAHLLIEEKTDKQIAEKLLSIELGEMGIGRGVSVEDLIPIAIKLREEFKNVG